MDGHIQAEAGAQDILAQKAVFIGIGDGFDPAFDAQEEFTADVDIRPARADGVAGDDHSLDDLVRITFNDFAVFESAGFTFVGVDGHDFWELRAPWA